MEYVIIGATAWLGLSILTAAGWAWLRTESRQRREIEEREELARAVMRARRSRPANPVQRIA